MKERAVKILDILSANKNVKVTLLSEMLDVSHVTLRKDLDYLEKRGIIRRMHGYASLDGADGEGKRMAINHSIKRRIAMAAAQIVEEGETIMIESGSCCALLAEELAFSQKNVTIITNSIYIINYVRHLRGAKLILLGGNYLPDSHVLVGPMITKSAENLFPAKFFLSVDGFIPAFGFTGSDYLRAETAAKLAERVKDVFILTDAAKFKRCGAYSLIRFNKLSGVFTDEGIPNEAETVLRKNNVRLHKAPSGERPFSQRSFFEQQLMRLNISRGSPKAVLC
ncbi:MAG: DeoR/GlpR family DNA-binding transcription regulator [Treponema sp.]|jgi:DeoR/GlpR family transcriptional regulator of sugar metabolism|nr:DeoR/GlpR family DNA-binding transcription regulator [Treponema sp.]